MTELQPLPEGFDPADYIAVKMIRMDGGLPLVRSAFGGLFHIGTEDAFALPVPAPTPPPWADVPPEGVWHATGQAIIENELEWGHYPTALIFKSAPPFRGEFYYAREPQRRTAATILDEFGAMVTGATRANGLRDLLDEYRAALTAEAGQ